MTHEELLKSLLETLHDGRLSRGERKALSAHLTEDPPDRDARARLRAGLFSALEDHSDSAAERSRLRWLRDVLTTIDRPESPNEARPITRFGPDDAMVETLRSFIGATRSTLDVAVFTITDDRVTSALLALHKRGVQVRILSDGDKAWDRGSDIERLHRGGVAVRCDTSPDHFHHKFAVQDSSALLTGSYNWTRSADSVNRENFLITRDAVLVREFSAAFAQMWAEMPSSPPA